MTHNGDAQSSGGKKMSNTPGKVRTGVDTHGLTPVTLVKEVCLYLRIGKINGLLAPPGRTCGTVMVDAARTTLPVFVPASSSLKSCLEYCSYVHYTH